jgi:hypothetical protein
MWRSSWIALLTVSCLLPATASSQSIGIYIDSGASVCLAEVGSTPIIDLHVIAVLGGEVPTMKGAQFWISGVPESWTPAKVFWVPDPAVTVNWGNPIFRTTVGDGRPGVDVAFNSCRGDGDPEDDTNHIELGRLIIAGAPTPRDVHLKVEHFELVPPDPHCPFVNDCDAPAFSKVCVAGGEVVLNGTGPCGVVAVAPLTWTGVKARYRE